jgi:hypothetical protein
VQHVRGIERAHLLEERARSQRVAEAEKVVHRALVEVEAMLRQPRERLDLGCERDAALLLRHEQRLDAERVARQGEFALAPIPDRDHAPSRRSHTSSRQQA